MIPSKWKTMRPDTARSLAMLITVAATAWELRTYDPETWKPVGAILSYWWVIIPAWLAYTFIEIQLIEWFGKKTEGASRRSSWTRLSAVWTTSSRPSIDCTAMSRNSTRS